VGRSGALFQMRHREKLKTVMRAGLLWLGLWALAACGAGDNTEQAVAPVFHAEKNPRQLSEWGLFDLSSGGLALRPGVVPYDLNSPLFTDYALKLRTIWHPASAEAAPLVAGAAPAFPVGTVISKTFYYPRARMDGADDGRLDVFKASQTKGKLNPALQDRSALHLVETRLLVRRDTGWEAVTYVWNAAQTDAELTKIGDVVPMRLHAAGAAVQDFAYIVPDMNQCSGCHAPNNTTRQIEPIGVQARHINKAFAYSDGLKNQVEYLGMIGYLDGPSATSSLPQNVDWEDASLPLSVRARAYLDINCAHCHNPAGPADTSGMMLTIDATDRELGLCKLPIAAGSGTGGRAYGIVPGAPDASILLYRLETTDPGAMMPELGRSLSHMEGAALVRAWIESLDGACGA